MWSEISRDIDLSFSFRLFARRFDIDLGRRFKIFIDSIRLVVFGHVCSYILILRRDLIMIVYIPRDLSLSDHRRRLFRRIRRPGTENEFDFEFIDCPYLFIEIYAILRIVAPKSFRIYLFIRSIDFDYVRVYILIIRRDSYAILYILRDLSLFDCRSS